MKIFTYGYQIVKSIKIIITNYSIWKRRNELK